MGKSSQLQKFTFFTHPIFVGDPIAQRNGGEQGGQLHLLHRGQGQELLAGGRQLFRGHDPTLPEAESALPAVM